MTTGTALFLRLSVTLFRILGGFKEGAEVDVLPLASLDAEFVHVIAVPDGHVAGVQERVCLDPLGQFHDVVVFIILTEGV